MKERLLRTGQRGAHRLGTLRELRQVRRYPRVLMGKPSSEGTSPGPRSWGSARLRASEPEVSSPRREPPTLTVGLKGARLGAELHFLGSSCPSPNWVSSWVVPLAAPAPPHTALCSVWGCGAGRPEPRLALPSPGSSRLDTAVVPLLVSRVLVLHVRKCVCPTAAGGGQPRRGKGLLLPSPSAGAHCAHGPAVFTVFTTRGSGPGPGWC